MQINFGKMNGLIPAVVQDARDDRVLMVGFMNQEALDRTIADNRVTFWSRTKQRLWQKGEESGNTLTVVSIHPDCDNDTVLVKAVPSGPVCHTGAATCFLDTPASTDILAALEHIIARRDAERPKGSYTTELLGKGTAAIAQKVGEEAIEVVVAALAQNEQRLIEESADLLYHILVLLCERGLTLGDVAGELERRMTKEQGKGNKS